MSGHERMELIPKDSTSQVHQICSWAHLSEVFEVRYRASKLHYIYLYFAKITRNVFAHIRTTMYVIKDLYKNQLTFNEFKFLY